MQINIYYGGRGLMDDPTLFVLKKMKEVLEELRVTVEVFHLYEQKNSIPTLPQTLKNADGNPCNDVRVVRYWRIYAAVFRCLLALWRQGEDQQDLYVSDCYVNHIRRTGG